MVQSIVSWWPTTAASIMVVRMLFTDAIQIFITFIAALLFSQDSTLHRDRHTILKIVHLLVIHSELGVQAPALVCLQ
jgi:ABC-type Na+ efflux pump permease subunit